MKARKCEATHPERLIACVATHEIETWMLALYRQELDTPWSEIRAECDPKERYAEPFLKNRGWTYEPGQGRKRAMRRLSEGWKGLLQVCPEIDELKNRISAWCTARSSGL